MNVIFKTVVVLTIFYWHSVSAQQSESRKPDVLRNGNETQDPRTARFGQLKARLIKGASPGYAKATANTQRVVAMSAYDVASGQRTDSIRLKYSGARSSAFDYFYVYYDACNTRDYPSIYDLYDPGPSYLEYDSMWEYNGSTVYLATRAYTSSGKVSRTVEDGYFATDFLYNTANKVTEAKQSMYSAMAWENDYRHLFYYNSSGHLILDSGQIWDGTAWQPDISDAFINNTSGLPIHVDERDYRRFGPAIISQTADLLYSTNPNSPNRVVFKFYNNITMALENSSLDTMGFIAGTLALHDSYEWSSSSGWSLENSERRRLNTNTMPDSVWIDTWHFSTHIRTDRTAISYNSQYNPVQILGYTNSSMSPDNKYLFYYEAVPGTVVENVTQRVPEFFPNPVHDLLYVGCEGSVEYVLFNEVGQLLQKGKIGKAVPVNMRQLPSGCYTILLKDNSGATFSRIIIKE